VLHHLLQIHERPVAVVWRISSEVQIT
jgi:hypothetical protein